MVFEKDQLARVRSGRQTAVLLLPTAGVRVGRTRRIWCRYDVHDGNGRVIGSVSQPVLLDDPESEERRALVVTIAEVEDLDVDALRLRHARPCGFRTSAELRLWWDKRHPRTPRVRWVGFELGDTRDVPRFLAHTRSFRAGIQGDYTSNSSQAADEAEVLSPDEYRTYAVENAQKDTARAASVSSSTRGEAASQRVARIEAGGAAAVAALRSELRVMELEVRRLERRISRGD